MIYIIKMLRVDECKKITINEKIVAITTDFERAIEILETNENNIQDNYYNYGLIITIRDGEIYDKPIDFKLYSYDLGRNEFYPFYYDEEEMYIYNIIKEKYC